MIQGYFVFKADSATYTGKQFKFKVLGVTKCKMLLEHFKLTNYKVYSLKYEVYQDGKLIARYTFNRRLYLLTGLLMPPLKQFTKNGKLPID